MRTVNIDLSRDITESREKIYVGYTGEHNATELVVKILSLIHISEPTRH